MASMSMSEAVRGLWVWSLRGVAGILDSAPRPLLGADGGRAQLTPGCGRACSRHCRALAVPPTCGEGPANTHLSHGLTHRSASHNQLCHADLRTHFLLSVRSGF